MKVFISWSGNISHRVAVALRDWLPSVIQNIEPYVSSEDIDKGTRWSTDIAGELHSAAYGLICLTRDNLSAPWINFEAGALGKSIEKSRVSPFLFRLKRSEVTGPLLQFQSTVFEKDDVYKLLKSINSACEAEGLEEQRLERTFDVWWPQLNDVLSKIEEPVVVVSKAQEESVQEVSSRLMEEILDLTRKNHKILRDPEALIPSDYFNHLMRRAYKIDGDLSPDALREVVILYRELVKAIIPLREIVGPMPEFDQVYRLIRKLDDPVRYIGREMRLRLPRDLRLSHDIESNGPEL